jgi:DNA gyrase inhibitor GyrI
LDRSKVLLLKGGKTCINLFPVFLNTTRSPDTGAYKVGPKVYRAADFPEGLQSTKIKGGKYSRFVLTGPYSGLTEAYGRVFEIVAETKIGLRDDYCIENYVNDPRTTPEQQLITEILIPTV